MAIMGGIYHWFPKMFGRKVNDTIARISWVFIFVGFNVTFFPQFILGAMGMPRRYFDYLPQFESLNKISSIGAWTIGLGFLVGLYCVLHALKKGEKAGENPWGATTLEWTTASPPIHENFETTPTITAGPYEYR